MMRETPGDRYRLSQAGQAMLQNEPAAEPIWRDLLLECHHRIKNHLQLVAGMLQLQARGCSDPGALLALRAAGAQVMAIGRLQLWPILYTDEEIVDVGEFLHGYCADLADALRTSVGQQAGPMLHVNLSHGAGSANAALTLAMIVSELVTNAVKHARATTIKVDWTLADGAWALTVSDDGVGAEQDFLDISTGLGSTLLKRLSASLHGEMAVETPARGTRITVRFGPGPLSLRPV
jgi:two-component sensor histidine kinase